jgi:catechol 2,3-dioxygenase
MKMPGGQPLKAALHHIGITSPDPTALSGFYERVMGLNVEPSARGILGQSADRRLYFLPGPAKALAFAAYALDDEVTLAGLEERLLESGSHYEKQDANELFEAGALSVQDPDGNRLIFGLPRRAVRGNAERLPARLQHVVVSSTDAPRLSEFYQNVFGFRLSDIVVDKEGGLRTAFLRCSEEHHSFAVFQSGKNSFDHHCYEVNGWDLIRDWGDHFAAHRVKVAWGPGRHGPGNNLFLFVHDSDGNWLEISTELEIVGPDRAVGEWPHEQRTLNSWGTGFLRS